MYKRILVPMALDHGVSDQTLKIARALGEGKAEVIALHVYEAPQGIVSAYMGENLMREGFEIAKKTLNEKVAAFDGITPAIVKGHSARSIIDYAKAAEVDCIVIASHQPGLGEFLLGSTASRVVRHAPCAVHVHRSD